MEPNNSQIQNFLTKAYDLSYKLGVSNTHIDLWFYQQVMSQLKNVLTDITNITYMRNNNELADVDASKQDKMAIIYDSGDKPVFMPDNPNVCVFKRLCCIALIRCDVSDFEGNAPFQLGIEISRHTLATIKNRATHFMLPFDILLYVDSDMLHKHGADALSTNIFNQNGYLFSPHIIPSIVTGALMQNDLANLTAFVAQPKALRELCTQMKMDIDKGLDDRDINEDALLALKVFKYRYCLPINPESIANLEQLESALQRDFDEISVKIGTDEIKITNYSE